MSIEFRKVTGATSVDKGKPETQAPLAELRIPPASKLQLEEHLFHFLCSVCNGRPQATTPLLVETKTLRALYTNPNHDLTVALQHCLDQFLIELGPDAARWGTLNLPTTVLGVALAVHNCLCPLPDLSVVKDPVLPFTPALIATIPPARTLAEMLVYHALLRHAVESLSVLSEDRVALIQALLNRSPLSIVYYLHLHTFPPLTALAADIWPWWKSRPVRPTPWANLDDWLQSLALLLAQPVIAAHLRRRWLSMSDTHLACRNLGLLLEALRRRGDQRAIILEFYEAFDYFCAEEVADPWHGTIRRWPLLDKIEGLLRAEGDSEAAIQLNRRGNEYFLLFRPLLEIIIAEHGLPRDYYHLTLDLIQALDSLLPLTTEAQIPRPQLQNVEFISEDKP
jgi:hypothetical protein